MGTGSCPESAIALDGAPAAREEPASRRLDQWENRAFWRLRWRVARTTVRQAVAEARFRVSLVVVLSAILWLGLFVLCVEGFHFLRVTISNPQMLEQTVRLVLGLFFASLMVMLVVSAGVILYGFLFQNREIAFLLTTPARPERVFVFKFQEAILLASWGFLLLGSPLLVAYGLASDAPWYYYAMLVPFMVAFVYIPAGLGAVACLAITYFFPSRRVEVFLGALAVAGGGLIWLGWSVLGNHSGNLLTPDWFQEMLGRLHFTEGRLLPSWWLSSGLMEATHARWSESVMFLTLLFSNALFLRQFATWMAGWTYRAAYQGLRAERGDRESSLLRLAVRTGRRVAAVADQMVDRLGIFLPKPMRLLMVKDLRLFRRDPVQWLQFTIFFGLLALYFANIRKFSYDVHYSGWVNMVSFLNLSVVGLLLSTFTTRFIFPMISLEGRRFWILGLLPVRRDTILWSKFLFALIGTIVPSCALVLLSDGMLRVQTTVILSHQLTCVVLCLGLAGLAVGLGARLPNFREQSPTRIAAGFGGTLTLVFSTLYIVAVVLLTAIPCHLYLGADDAHGLLFDHGGSVQSWFRLWFAAGTAGSVLLGLVTTVVPLWLGFRSFRRLEF